MCWRTGKFSERKNKKKGTQSYMCLECGLKRCLECGLKRMWTEKMSELLMWTEKMSELLMWTEKKMWTEE